MNDLITNTHFIYFLIDVTIWVAIAVIVSNSGIKTKSYKLNMNKSITLIVIIFALGAGFFSVLTNGLPEFGFSIISFVYATFVSIFLVFSQRIKIKSQILPKISKTNKKVRYI